MKINKYFQEKKEDLQIDYDEFNSICKNCNNDDIRYNGEFYICIGCGLCQEHRIFYQTPCFIDNISFRCKYKRIKHFNKIIRSITGSMIATVPDDVIEIIKKYQFDTIFELKSVMKKLKLKKYYLSSYYIFKTIKNQNLIELDNNTIRIMINMFRRIDSCFIDLRETYDEKRQNTFQYHYLIRKILRILGKEQHLRHLSLMKSKDKLIYSEKLFEMICKRLGYRFIPEVD
tara:strand:- start:290 stop:979 length:690 start_codon:yes stop_codon:yes gene_type:complete